MNGHATAEQLSANVSGSAGAEVSTHFVLYGTDVWAQGENWSRPSVFAWTDVTLDFGAFDVTNGVWFELRDQTGPLGGAIQEVDWYIGAGKSFGRVRADVTFQAWHYGPVENVLDVAIGFDDSDLLFEGFALNPSVVAHTRLSAGQGTVFVFGIEPGWAIDLGAQPVSLSIPASIAFGVDDFFMEDGYGYASVGLAAGLPLTFIPEEYGAWELTASTTYYFTDEDALGNPEDNFLTGAVGVGMSF
ncbi:MAG: hypothetical protein WD009_10890 [Phycisphaeraceae bacterium]